ncbi:MAG: hypothetical protein E5V74_03115 [Mesorhizobium sp.]|nr:MAG: hypothetical protein E5W03_02890 [Mesorhizobium sp.]TIV25113.1 MAG: hypothetical protein E5W02_00610 [Mesorhizobium sp.]TIV68255.1 MAG: hypothetical protein E5V86_01605 [Mesorhizobium sp.]TIW05395.1 MAG: hypothetical protein E5V74_03115 [Mesorhizobium sp.]
MTGLRLLALPVVSLLGLSFAAAAEKSVAERYDLNHNGYIDEGEEMHVLALHYASPVLRAYDVAPTDGKLSKNEIQAIYDTAESRLSDNESVQATLGPLLDKLSRAHGRLPIKDANIDFTGIDAAIEVGEKDLEPECSVKQRLFLRRDKVDMSLYDNTLGAEQSKGASIRVNHDYVLGQTTATIDAATAVVLFRNACPDPGTQDITKGFVAGYSLAAYSDLAGEFGTGNRDLKSNAEIGLDGQLQIQGGPFRYTYVTAGAYYLTDFHGEASGYGFQATVQPYDERYHLGITRKDNPYLSWYVTPILRIDSVQVNDGGFTGLADDTQYLWLGGDFELTAFLYPEKFGHRFYVKANANLYWDALGDRFVDQYGAGLFYNVDPAGNTSVSTEYVYGTDRKKLRHEDKVTVNFNVKY